MKKRQNEYRRNRWVALICLILIFFFFLSEKGQERVDTWISLLEVPENQDTNVPVYRVDFERELEKNRVSEWISRKYKVSRKAVRKIVDICKNTTKLKYQDDY